MESTRFQSKILLNHKRMEALWSNPLYIGTRFVQVAKQKGFTLKQIKEFKSQQEAYQLTKQKKAKLPYFPILRPPGSYQCDLMFLNNPRNKTKQLPVLCFIDTNTRYAYTYLLKSKEAFEVQKAFGKFMMESKGKCQFLQSDNGSEFINKELQKWLKENDVIHSTVEPGDHKGQGSVERFNKTIKFLITQITDQTGMPWTDFLPQITENYNNRVHSAIGVAPADADDNEGRFARYLSYLDARKELDKFQVGDQVRKELYRHALEKGPVRWSKEVFTVKSIEGNHVVLNDGTKFQYHNLQKIDGVAEKAQGPTDEERAQVVKAKKKERDFRAEGIAKAEEFDGEQFVGRRFRKKYGKKWVNGVVMKYDKPKRGDPKNGFNWLVVHDDQDEETVDYAELMKYLVKTKKA